MSAVTHDRRIEMLDRSIEFTPDGEVPHDDGYCLVVPETPGIYMFHDWRGPLYIGKGENLRRRFSEHFTTHNPHLAAALNSPVGVIKFVWLNVELVDLDTVESRIINELCPICNIRLNSRRETRTRRGC